MTYQRIAVIDSPNSPNSSTPLYNRGTSHRGDARSSESQKDNQNPTLNGSNNESIALETPPIYNDDDDDDEISEYSRVRLLMQPVIVWNEKDCDSLLKISLQGLGISCIGPTHGPPGYSGVRANKPFSLRPGVGKFNYFEIRVLEGGGSKSVTRPSPLL